MENKKVKKEKKEFCIGENKFIDFHLDDILPNKNIKSILFLGNLTGLFGFYDEIKQDIDIERTHPKILDNAMNFEDYILSGRKFTVIGTHNTVKYFSDFLSKWSDHGKLVKLANKNGSKCIDIEKLPKDYKNNYVNILKYEKDKNVSFDCVIMNPPYDRNLHLKILDFIVSNFPEAEVVNLSPIRWLEDPLAKYKKNSDFNKYENIRNHIESLVEIPAVGMNTSFNIVLNIDLGIYHIVSNKKSSFNIEETLSKNNLFKICQKIYLSNNIYKNYDFNKKDGWRVRMFTIGGGKSGGSGDRTLLLEKQKYSMPKLLYFYNGKKDGKPWYDFYKKNQYSKITEEITASIKFNSEIEAQNFINTENLKLSRFYYNNILQDVHVLPEFFLKLDYTHPWTDEMLYEYFKLTPDEIKIIENEMSDNESN